MCFAGNEASLHLSAKISVSLPALPCARCTHSGDWILLHLFALKLLSLVLDRILATIVQGISLTERAAIKIAIVAMWPAIACIVSSGRAHRRVHKAEVQRY